MGEALVEGVADGVALADGVVLPEPVALPDAVGVTDAVGDAGLPHAESARTTATRPARRRIGLNSG
ncbi:MAG: hypothetical protein ABI534_09585 [Chloroflexota bacterium]